MARLSDSEIEIRFAFLFAEAAEAFRTDPEYVVRIGEHVGWMLEQGQLPLKQRERKHRARVEHSAPEPKQPEAAPEPDPKEQRNAKIVRLRAGGLTHSEIGLSVGSVLPA